MGIFHIQQKSSLYFKKTISKPPSLKIFYHAGYEECEGKDSKLFMVK